MLTGERQGDGAEESGPALLVPHACLSAGQRAAGATRVLRGTGRGHSTAHPYGHAAERPAPHRRGTVCTGMRALLSHLGSNKANEELEPLISTARIT